MVHLRSNQKVGFCFDGSAALKKTGRFFVAVEPPKEERRVLDMVQGGVKDNVGDEMNEAAGRGGREGEQRKETTPKEARRPASGGVKDNVQDEFDGSREERH